MKTKLTTFKLLILLSCSFATTAVFGQATLTWTGATDGTNLETAGNWTPAQVPVPNNLDTCEWNGLTTIPLNLTEVGSALTGGSGGTRGLTLYLTANQTNSVQIGTRVSANSGAIRLNGVTLDPGAAPFTLGDTNKQFFVDVIWGGVAGQNHDLLNNSTNPATMYPNVQFRYGGGGNHNMIIDGSGDWDIRHYLITQNGAGTTVNKLGTGTMYWTGTNIAAIVLNSIINSPVTFNEGRIVLQTSDLLNSQGIQNNGSDTTVLEYRATAPGQGNLSGTISGPIAVVVDSGSLKLSGANTFTGNVTNNGGEVIANRAENAGVSGPFGVGGTISFYGGMLGYSSLNSFDYSSRFSTDVNQAYSIDVPGGQFATFATGLNSSGGSLAKAGAGTLTIAGASSYSGATTVSGGALVFAKGAKTGTGPVTVAGGGNFGVTDPAGSQVTASTLTLSDGAALSFYNVTNTLAPPLGVTNLVASGTTTINVPSGTFQNATSYPLLAWDNGTAPGTSLGILNGALGNISTNGNQIRLNITALADSWNGNVDGNWTSVNNWLSGGSPATYVDPTPVVFGDSASGTTTVTVNALVKPNSVTINNSSLTYSIASSGGNNIGGNASLSKLGTGTATLSGGANTYTNVTTISGGILSVSALANGGSASDIGAAGNSAANLVLSGGTLRYTGADASIDRLFTLTPSGGSIDGSGSGALGLLNLTNVGSILVSGGGAHGLIVTGTGTNTLASVLSDGSGGGSASLTKNGTGEWILTGTNTYSGGTIINSGVLQVGASPSGTLGSGSVDDEATLVFQRSGTLVVPGVISGNGSVIVSGGGTIILANNNTYKGGTTISNANDTLQIGNGGSSGSLYSAGGVVDNGTLIFNGTGIFTLEGGNAIISGPGNVIVSGTGLFQAEGANTYTGWTLINPGATFQPCTGNEGQLLSSVITNNGTLKFVRQDWGVYGYTNNIVGSGRVWKDVNNVNPGDVTLMGTNTYTGGTIIAGGGIVLGDGATPGAGVIVGSVMFTNSVVVDGPKYFEFNRPDNLTFANPISGLGTTANPGFVVQNGNNIVTLTGNNTYSGGTAISSNGIVQVGNGGTSGSIGSGPVILASPTTNCAIVFDRSDNVSVSIITGPYGSYSQFGLPYLFTGTPTNGTGSLVQFGSGTLTIGPTNDYVGSTTVSNGTLVVTGGSLGGELDVKGGTLVAGGVGSVSTLNVAGNMNISAGTVVASLNKSLSPSNTTYAVAGAINYTGGTLKLVNYGPALVAGDKFTVFSKPVTGGGAMTIVSPGFTVNNNLAVDGSVTVSGILPQPTIIAAPGVGGTTLTLSWPPGWTGLYLQSQTNSLAIGLKTNWVTIAGTDASNSYVITIDRTKPTVFYRLVQ